MADNTIGIAPENTVVVQPGASANHTTRVINNALEEGGAVSLTAPGRYTVNASMYNTAALLIPSDTHFYIGPGVELFLENGSNVALMANSNAFSTGVLLSAGQLTASGSTLTVNRTGIGLAYPVGSWISVDFVATKCYQGVYQVETASPNTITFTQYNANLLTTSPAVAMAINAPFDTTGTLAPLAIAIRPANNNIRIWGGGLINANGANQTSSVSGDPRGFACYMRGVANSTVEGLFTRRARCWTFAFNNTLNCFARNLVGDNYIGGNIGANANDIVHSTGENRNLVIENIYAISIGDNVVGSTLDYTDTSLTALPYAWQTPGDNHNSTVRNIGAKQSGAPVVTKWGNVNFGFLGTHIVENIYGSAPSGFSMTNYTPTTMFNCSGNVLQIKNVSVSNGTNPVILSANGAWDLIEVDSVRSIRSGPNVQVRLSPGGTPSVIGIKQLKLSKMTYTPSTDGVNRPLATIGVGGTLAGTAYVGYLDISDIEEMPMAANAPLVHIGNDTTTLASIKRISLNNVSAVGLSGTGSLVQVALASTVNEIVLNAARYTGTGGTGTLVNLGASVVAGTQVQFGQGCSAPSAASFITSAATIGRLNGANAQFDPGAAGANITAPIPGDVFYNTNAAFGVPGVGVYMRGAAAWTRIAA